MTQFNTYSASKLKLLDDCRHLYYPKYILKDLKDADAGPFALLGKALHKVLEEYRKNPTMSRNELQRQFAEAFPLQPTNFLYKEGLQILHNIKLRNVVRGELISVEWEFEEAVEDVVIRGIVDKIEKIGENKILVTDYKSNKAINAIEYIPQLALYDLVLSKRFPDIERVHELFYLRFNRTLTFSFDDTMRKKIWKKLQSAHTYINENHDTALMWPKRLQQDKICSFCPLSKTCWPK